jgi:hypothetical protein
MANPLFSKLFNHSAAGLENFANEVLAGVLRSNQQLLDKFVNKVLGIKGTKFVLATQKVYPNLPVAMVFSNENTLCFLENAIQPLVADKISHLQKCETILLAEQQNHINVYLRYCSKHYHTQAVKNVNFAQYRWADVFIFFQNYTDNCLVTAFLEFMQEQNMRGVTELKTEDLMAMSTLDDTLSQIDECLDSVATEFTMLFGHPSRGAPGERLERLKLLMELKSYRMMKQDILFGDGGWSEITLCLDYEKLANSAVTWAIWYWCDKSHSQYEIFKEQFLQHKHLFAIHPGFSYEDRTTGVKILLQKALTDFDAEPNRLQAIHDWLVETLWIFRKFADKTAQLRWNMPKRE